MAPASWFRREVGRSGTGAQQKPRPPAVLSLRTDLRAADEITFRDQADQLSAGIDHRKPADGLCSIVSAASAIVVSGPPVTLPGHNLR